MLCGNSSGFATTAVVRRGALVALTLTTLLAAPAAYAVDSGDIVMVSMKGEVHITVKGVVRELRAGGVLEPPATLRTGPDGAAELRQGATTVSVGPETLLEFPALEKRGAPIDRIVQPSGSAFYNIGKREGRKLRVETPYIVGVIKGTQFNVVVQDGTATISLFEGLLDVRSTDDDATIDLKAGEIASRKRGDKSIGVMKMDGVRAAPTGARAPVGTSTDTRPSGQSDMAIKSIDESLLVESNLAFDTPANTDVRVSGPAADADVPVMPGNSPEVVVGAVDVPGAIDVVTNVNVDAGPAAVEVGATTGVDLGVDLGVGTVGTDTAVGTVDVSVPVADVDLGLDDDGNNGHGNDSDGSDSSNPGRGSDHKGPGNTDPGNLLDDLTRPHNKK